jgi:hypothetical protein
MIKRFAIGLLCSVSGYILFAFAGYFLIEWFSSNVHDRSVEAAMTSAFVFGPIGVLVGFAAGFILGGRTSRASSAGG